FGVLGFWLYPGFIDLAAGFGILFSSIGLILVLVIKMVLANSSRTHQGLYGSARWADKKDIQNAGLIGARKKQGIDSVYVGGWQDNSGTVHYLKHGGPEHILCYAPTRSGKGVSLAYRLCFPKLRMQSLLISKVSYEH
ncbi:type IV secretory system conjugative DNA transfer family protein, partial [Nitrosomonas sp. JL21]|uniref:type IV secretory system conjugative DNA transfer family protein n=1 Tax=Nitrosomonas sp. JL21 TaxID=153949 RepID=UPI001F0481DB